MNPGRGGHRQRQKTRKYQPAADFPLRFLTLTGSGEAPDALRASPPKPPPAAPTMTLPIRRTITTNVAKPPRLFSRMKNSMACATNRTEGHQQRKPQAVAEVGEQPSGHQHGVRGHRAVLALRRLGEPAIDIVH